MKTAIKIIKRQQKLKEPIKLRVKNLKNGNQSLYLDIYWQGKRTYQFLYLYLVPEINEQTIAQNQEVARQALLIKSRKIIKLLGNMPKHEGNGATRKYYLLDFIQKYADERKPKTGNCTKGRYGSIISLKKHLMKFGAKNTLVGEVDTKFVEHFIDYLREAHDLHPNRKNPSKLSEGTIYLMYSSSKYHHRTVQKEVDSPESILFSLPSIPSEASGINQKLSKQERTRKSHPVRMQVSSTERSLSLQLLHGITEERHTKSYLGRDYSREWQSLYPKENPEDAAMAQDSIIPASDAMAAKAPWEEHERNYFR